MSHSLVGVHAAFVVHATQSPLSQTSLVPHVVPLASSVSWCASGDARRAGRDFTRVAIVGRRARRPDGAWVARPVVADLVRTARRAVGHVRTRIGAGERRARDRSHVARVGRRARLVTRRAGAVVAGFVGAAGRAVGDLSRGGVAHRDARRARGRPLEARVARCADRPCRAGIARAVVADLVGAARRAVADVVARVDAHGDARSSTMSSPCGTGSSECTRRPRCTPSTFRCRRPRWFRTTSRCRRRCPSRRTRRRPFEHDVEPV